MFPLFVPKIKTLNKYLYLPPQTLLLLRKQVGFDKHSAYRINFQLRNGKA
jgi:hypothetical protein